MRLLYVFSAIAVALALWLGVSANDAREAMNNARANNEVLRTELAGLATEVAAMQKVEPSPLRFSDDALATFFSRTIEAGEVLGAGVRVEARDSALSARPMSFGEFRQGVLVCPVRLQVAMEGENAPATLSMFEEELADLPIAVRKLTARVSGPEVALLMDIDVFGRTP